MVTVTAIQGRSFKLQPQAAIHGERRRLGAHDSFSKLRGQKGNSHPGAFCPFAPVESVLVAKVSIGERRGWPGDEQ